MKNSQSIEKHCFALYHSDLSDELNQAIIGKEIIIDDPELTHRIISILRLSINESFILFDRNFHSLVELSGFVKNKIIKVIIKEKQNNTIFIPEIKFILPLLKKESLEAVLYSLTEIGMNSIQLIYTQKSQMRWAEKEMQRAQKIIIAAAEQSKNFNYPQLKAPVSIESVMDTVGQNSIKLFFDPVGISLSAQLQQFKNGNNSFVLLIGPEGDLTTSEKDLVKINGFSFVSLTPTILRASQAATIAAGILRAYIR